MARARDKRRYRVGVLRRHRLRRRLEGGPERIGSFLSSAKRQPLRLEVRVLDGERQDLFVQRLVFGEPHREGVEMLNFSRITEGLKDRLEPVDVLLNRLLRLFGFPRGPRGRFIRIRHHGPVRRIGGLRELHVEVRRKPPRLDQLHQSRFTFATRD